MSLVEALGRHGMSRDAEAPLLVNVRAGMRLKRDVLLPEDRRLACVVHAALWLAGGLTLAPLLVIPSIPHRHQLAGMILLGIALAVGAVSALMFREMQRPERYMPALSVLGVIVLSAAAWTTGGSHSPAWIYLLVSVLYSSYFYPPKLGGGFLMLVVAGLAAPLAYEPGARHSFFIVQWALAAGVFLLVGGTIMVGRALGLLYRRHADQLGDQERAMRVIASAVLEGAGRDELEMIAAREIASIYEGLCFTVLRLDTPRQATVLGLWPPTDAPGLAEHQPVALGGQRLAPAIAGRVPVLLTSVTEVNPLLGESFEAAIVAPIAVPGSRARAIVAFAPERASVSVEDAERIMALGGVLQSAIRSVREQSKLAEEAATDALTGLANYRRLQTELDAAVRRAGAREQPLSVVALDLDEFKTINDTAGHDFGDTVIRRVAAAMRASARPEDTIGRRGGDEFVWVMPGLTAAAALNCVESTRLLIENRHDDSFRVTFSAGISDRSMATGAAELLALADDALYWSKEHGRDRTCIHNTEDVAQLTSEERAEVLARSQAQLGLQALARVIDARHPVTRQHSERVADLAGRMARASGWEEERIALLRDAALVHDIGLVGVPAALLHQSSRLPPAEQEQVDRHVELSVSMAEGVLADEQLTWIREHHERPDGRGYPRGLGPGAVSEGGALLAVANAYDMLLTGRAHAPGLSPGQALDRCRAGAGSEFSGAAVVALERALAQGDDGAAGANPANDPASNAARDPASSAARDAVSR
jgi:diguanylate cyclase (GGDEF)-like protein